jgi:glycosyltransferase involved in cell wall biosynthesis|tara:strand:- start:1515 stop:2276 length:762 start_codon:yes stop_codon:yes gene_type:complete
MDNLKITIITVSFNSEKTIKKTLESVANQSYKEIEHLIIDGKSIDKTILIAKKFPHIKKIISSSDNGIYHAMNKGLVLARGDIIGFLNSDDFYANDEVIATVAREFKKDTSLEACYADLIYVSRFKTSKIIRYFKSKKFRKGLFSKGWCPPHPTFFVRRSVYQQFGKFDLNYRIASDVDLMMRFLEIHKVKFCYIPEIWVKMRMGGITNKNLKNIWLQNQEILNSFNKNGLAVQPISFFIYKIFSRIYQYLKR